MAIAHYINQKVRLWPNDTSPKEAIVMSVDEFGWTFLVISTAPNRNRPTLTMTVDSKDGPVKLTGYELFVSTSYPLMFEPIE